MSFMTERYFQILENHKVYKNLTDEAALRVFLEHHVLCVWGYGFLLRNLYQDLALRLEPLATHSQKEAQRLVAEIMIEEEFEEQEDGTLSSHLETYLEAMQVLGADMTPILNLFDLYENGQTWKFGLQQGSFPEAAVRYARCILSYAERPLHERAALLFYEGEPFIPDTFLTQIASMGPKGELLVDYFEKHIEGLKKPGFSASGRLVELFCGDDENLNAEAEKTAELIMGLRIELWNEIAARVEDKKEETAPRHLKLVSIDFARKQETDKDIESAS